MSSWQGSDAASTVWPMAQRKQFERASPTLFRIAVHEAGHAVAAATLGVPFAHVTLAVLDDEDRDLDGPHVWQPEGATRIWMRGGPLRDRGTRVTNRFRAIVVRLAGPVAESDWSGHPLVDVFAEGGAYDLENAASIAKKLASGPGGGARVLGAALARTGAIMRVGPARSAVLRVAMALHQRGRLEHDEVIALVDRCTRSE